jgi:hypothetical protein
MMKVSFLVDPQHFDVFKFNFLCKKHNARIVSKVKVFFASQTTSEHNKAIFANKKAFCLTEGSCNR